jgi:hypothetical protein
MDVVYKGGSLLYTQLSTVARMAVSLPRYVLANLSHQQSPAAEPHPGVPPSQTGPLCAAAAACMAFIGLCMF